MTPSCVGAVCCFLCCAEPPDLSAYPDQVRTIPRSAAAVLLGVVGTLAGAGTAAADPGGPITNDGTYTVGKDIAPGVYASAGPVGGAVCYWRRAGADNATLNNAMSKQPQVVAIEPTDATFRTKGCQPWQLTDAPVPAPTPPWLSQLQLRHSLDVLNGLAGQSGNGQLPPY